MKCIAAQCIAGDCSVHMQAGSAVHYMRLHYAMMCSLVQDMCVCVCVRARVHACVRARMRACCC